MKKKIDKLETCKVCIKRKFNPKMGIVCSITDLKPAFVDDCSDYEVDEIVYSKTNSEGMPSIYSGLSEEFKNEDGKISKGKVTFNIFRFIFSFFR